MPNQEIIETIQAELGIDYSIKLFMYPDMVMYGIIDDRPTLMKFPCAHNLGWEPKNPHESWMRCYFKGTIVTNLGLFRLPMFPVLLSGLPSEVGDLVHLEVLSCSNNELRTLPSELGKLQKLQELHCGGNKLRKLPSELGNLTNLQSLCCAGNELTDLPSELGQLTNLQKLSCHGNELTALPSELGQLTNLQELSCRGNRLTALPPEVLALQDMGCQIYFGE